MHTRGLLCILILAFAALAASCVKHKTPAPPTATTHQERLGDSFYQTGNFEMALQEYDKALKEGASAASVAYRKGFAYFSRDEWDEALAEFTHAIQADPNLTIAYEGAGMASFQIGKLDDAIRYFETTREQAPEHWVPYAFLAAIFHVRGRTEEAKLFHDQALLLGGEEQRPLVVSTLRDAHARALRLSTQVSDPEKESPASETSGQDVAEQAAEASQSGQEPDKQREEAEAKLQALAEKQRQEEEAEKARIASGMRPAEAKEPAPPKKPVEKVATPAPPQAQKPTTKPAETPPATPAPKKQAEPRKEPAPQPTPAATPEAKPAKPAPPKAQAASPNTPQVIEAEPLKGEEPEPVPNQPGPYAILESSFKNEAQAERRVSELRKQGLAAYTTRANLGSRGVWYRVLFGPFEDLHAAREAKERLMRQHKIKDMVIMKQR